MSKSSGLLLFFVLACGLTWSLDVPWVLAVLQGQPPPPYAMNLTGLGALGPTLAAVLVAWPRGESRQVFGRWRTHPLWIVVALFAPGALHLVATLLEVALGGHPAQWFYPPVEPERIAALLMFPIGEEFGWRGFAHPRITARFGMVTGSLLLGLVWGVWHVGMMFQPGSGVAHALTATGLAALELALWSVCFAWFFERSGRSMAVAIALHAGAHLDNVNRAPEGEIRLRVLRLAVVAVAAGLAAWALTRKRKAEVA